jgi:hypothetical protein
MHISKVADCTLSWHDYLIQVNSYVARWDLTELWLGTHLVIPPHTDAILRGRDDLSTLFLRSGFILRLSTFAIQLILKLFHNCTGVLRYTKDTLGQCLICTVLCASCCWSFRRVLISSRDASFLDVVRLCRFEIFNSRCWIVGRWLLNWCR